MLVYLGSRSGIIAGILGCLRFLFISWLCTLLLRYPNLLFKPSRLFPLSRRKGEFPSQTASSSHTQGDILFHQATKRRRYSAIITCCWMAVFRSSSCSRTELGDFDVECRRCNTEVYGTVMLDCAPNGSATLRKHPRWIRCPAVCPVSEDISSIHKGC